MRQRDATAHSDSQTAGHSAENNQKIVELSVVKQYSGSWKSRLPMLFASLASAAWLGFVGLYASSAMAPIGAITISELASRFAAPILLPVIVFWLVAAVTYRNRAVEDNIQALTRALNKLHETSDGSKPPLSQITAALQQQTDGLSTAAAFADQQVNRLRETFQAAAGLLDKNAEDTRQQSESIRIMLEDERTQMAALTETIAQQAQSTQDHFIVSARQLSGAFDIAARKADQVGHDVQAYLDNLDQATAKLEKKLAEMRHGFAEHLSEIRESADHTAWESEVIGETFRRHSQDMSDATLQATDRVEKLVHAMQEQIAVLQRMSSTIDTQAHQVRDTVSAHGHQLTTLCDQIFETLRQAETTLGAHAQAMLAEFGKAGEQVKLIGQDTADDMAQHAEQLMVAALATHDALTERLQQAQDTLDARNTAIEGAAERANQNILESSRDTLQAFEQELDQLRLAVATADQEILATGTRFHDLQISLTKTARSNLEELQRASGDLDDKRAALIMVSEDQSSKLRALANDFGQTTSQLSTLTATASERLAFAGKTFRDRVTNLETAAHDASEKITDAGRHIELQTDHMHTESGRHLAAAVESQQHLKSAFEMTASAVEQAANLMRETHQQLVRQQQDAVEFGEKSAAQTRQQIQALIEQTDDIGKTAQGAVAQIQRLDKNLTEHSRAIGKASGQARVAAHQTIAELAHHTHGMDRTITSLIETANKLQRQTQAPLEDSFLLTSRRVMETLDSLAIDLTRFLEAELPEHMWRRYLRGDRRVFSRRLARLSGRAARRRITERFQSDPEFRDTVTRYFGQCEDLLAKAVRADPNNAFGVTFLSSDTGKIYLLLSHALKRVG